MKSKLHFHDRTQSFRIITHPSTTPINPAGFCLYPSCSQWHLGNTSRTLGFPPSPP
ncbi:hypothetical protein M422DRAFT_25979 [Sphaerobolus stellatus SS14]|nr:hypothetical protein M422DRAFT_25979 [Sphaerobolus stellatus SS14]